ncbi:Myosin light chain kinase family member 4, partial [Galemys pyrenaicus]
AKEKLWPHPGLDEATCAKGRRTPCCTESSSQKQQPTSEEEKVHKLNKKNAETTRIPPVERGLVALPAERPRDPVEGSGPRNATEPRGNTDRRGTLCVWRPDGEDENSAPAGDHEGAALFHREQSRGEAGGERDSSSASQRALGTRSDKQQQAGGTDTDGAYERSTRGGQATSQWPVPGSAVAGPEPQNTDPVEHAGLSKRRVPEGRATKEDHKKSRTEAAGPGGGGAWGRTPETAHAQGQGEAGSCQDQDPAGEAPASEPPGERDPGPQLDDVPAPPAPFSHRIVTAKPVAVNSFYTVNRTEMLGGGRFGQVHRCEEKATGLKLAAKIIKTRNRKEKDEVKNEITIMNQLDHVNLIQLYDAFESRNDVVLVMEYVDGGELFDRIVDDNYNLTELDTILFIKQICEGIRHMHQMYILHLDLKVECVCVMWDPENILCVNRDAKQIKIIDFGLARRYKPREKLKVNFGTPEFLAPEVVNYDFVSFSTDMWSVGVITYMLLSGLSPFLGDTDVETLNNILACRWDLEEEEFQDLSDEGREFISKLLIKEKSWRISASEALKHPWLSDHKLHSRLKAQ